MDMTHHKHTTEIDDTQTCMSSILCAFANISHANRYLDQ